MTSALLPQLAWRPDVHERLRALLDRHRDRPAGAPAPVAALDFDNTCIFNDIGELFAHYLIDEMLYRYDLDAFWELIDPADGRDALYDVTHRALAVPAERRAHSDAYHQYRFEMGSLYGRRLARAGKADCYEWAVRLHVGLTPAQMHAFTRAAIDRELTRPVELEQRTGACGTTTTVARGIRPFDEIHTLIGALHAADFEVWIVSATNVWTVQGFAPQFGVAPERVIGNRLHIGDDGRLTSRTLPPVTYRQGKVDAILETIGRDPTLAMGDAETDFEMLCAARELAVVIDKGDALLRREAPARGWAIQPQDELSHACGLAWETSTP